MRKDRNKSDPLYNLGLNLKKFEDDEAERKFAELERQNKHCLWNDPERI